MRRSSGESCAPSTSPINPRPTSMASGSTRSSDSTLSLAAAGLPASSDGVPPPARATSFLRIFQPAAQAPQPKQQERQFRHAGKRRQRHSTPPASMIGCELPRICLWNSAPSRASLLARVTISAPEMEIISAGMTVTRPSPMVSTVYVSIALRRSIPCCSTPIRKPAMMLIAVIRMLATASRCVKRDAPSMAP